MTKFCVPSLFMSWAKQPSKLATEQHKKLDLEHSVMPLPVTARLLGK